jgi:rubrerythrin
VERDGSHDALAPEVPPRGEQIAAEVGAIVAAEVRREIWAAERAADELRRRGRDGEAADRAEVERRAARALEEIKAVEQRIAGLLQGLRDDVTRLAVASDLPQPRPVAQPAATLPRRRFWRRRGALPPCSVCGRVAESNDDARERWRRSARISLCPGCQADGWQLPDRGMVPYRATQQANAT